MYQLMKSIKNGWKKIEGEIYHDESNARAAVIEYITATNCKDAITIMDTESGEIDSGYCNLV